VRDVGAGFVAITDSAVEEPVNLASGIGISIRSLCEKLGALCQRPDLLQFEKFPDRPDDPPGLIAGLRDEVGFTPAISLEAGLSHTVVERWRPSVATSAPIIGTERWLVRPISRIG
jgi:nucleoside-diphosphate-sugar epimerase